VIPTATSSCDIAQFLTDVTIPDGTIIPAGQAFTKTWRFRNAGNCSGPRVTVVFSSGNQMGGPNTGPGRECESRRECGYLFNLTAPTAPGDIAATGNYATPRGPVREVRVKSKYRW
jgi:hypothetical protein